MDFFLLKVTKIRLLKPTYHFYVNTSFFYRLQDSCKGENLHYKISLSHFNLKISKSQSLPI